MKMKGKKRGGGEYKKEKKRKERDQFM